MQDTLIFSKQLRKVLKYGNLNMLTFFGRVTAYFTSYEVYKEGHYWLHLAIKQQLLEWSKIKV